MYLTFLATHKGVWGALMAGAVGKRQSRALAEFSVDGDGLCHLLHELLLLGNDGDGSFL